MGQQAYEEELATDEEETNEEEALLLEVRAEDGVDEASTEAEETAEEMAEEMALLCDGEASGSQSIQSLQEFDTLQRRAESERRRQNSRRNGADLGRRSALGLGGGRADDAGGDGDGDTGGVAVLYRAARRRLAFISWPSLLVRARRWFDRASAALSDSPAVQQ